MYFFKATAQKVGLSKEPTVQLQPWKPKWKKSIIGRTSLICYVCLKTTAQKEGLSKEPTVQLQPYDKWKKSFIKTYKTVAEFRELEVWCCGCYGDGGVE